MLSGDPPAANRGAPSKPVPTGQVTEGCPRSRSGGSTSTVFRQEILRSSDSDGRRELRGKGPALDSVEVPGRSELRPGASYKEALVGVRTFKPRFDTSKRPEEWNDYSPRRRPARSVWGRLGPSPGTVQDRLAHRGSAFDRLGERVPLGQQGNGYLQILKTKAVGRCYNCLASDHRIAACRDPPKCILCSRSGHKARRCPRRAPAAIWRRRAPAAPIAGAAAPSCGGAPASTPEDSVPAPSASPLPTMERIPGEAWRRPAHVSACAARTSDVREMEQDLQLHALVAVQIDARAQLTCDGVLRDALQQLRIPQHALKVTRISTSTFLLRFQTPDMRNAARSCRAIVVGHTSLHLMPWGRQVGAAAAVTNLFYRARVCFEGVPGHAHQVESVLNLLPRQSFVEEIDYTREREDEKGCFILWIWCKDPEAISVLGTLQVQEPLVLPEGYVHMDDDPQLPVLRSDAVTLLNYDVLIHLDRVEDYNPAHISPSVGSFVSDTSGLPGDDSMAQWPGRHRFLWHLGQPDALPDPPRAPVHSRLGGRRDRSPLRGGGAGGVYRVPPPNQFDMSRSVFGGAGPSVHRNNAETDYQGWNRNNSNEVEPEDSWNISKYSSDHQCKTDPMMDEAAINTTKACSRPMLSQCSVEPTTTNRVCVVSGPLDGFEVDLQADGDRQINDDRQGKIDMISQKIGEVQLIGDVNETVHGGSNSATLELHLSHDKDKTTQDIGLLNSLVADGPLFGNMFDLNQECEMNIETLQPEGEAIHDNQETERAASLNDRDILGPAEGRLNKHSKEQVGHKNGPRGMLRLAVPLKKALLCPPVNKPKTPRAKKPPNADDINSVLKNHKGTTLALDERATALLMRTSGVLGDNEQPSDSSLAVFGNQFVSPMQDDLLGDMRATFGMPLNGGADSLSALLCDADVQDD
ncbi:unnamed protein product [Urochloa decumbens]|uniref:CCHC-type domain-containing protein n=1 Tax=Urochloa decumbens TaxID=240449 RepID=A0ABC8ZYP9_9POAL